MAKDLAIQNEAYMICLGTDFFLLVSVEVLLQGYSPWTLSVQMKHLLYYLSHTCAQWSA